MENNQNQNLNINIIVWAETNDEATSLAKELTKGTENEGVYKGTLDDVTLNIYPKSAEGLSSNIPSGYADLLILKLNSNDSDNKEKAISYLNNNKSVPYKIVTSDADLSDIAKDVEGEYVQFSEITGDLKKASIIKSVRSLDETLKKAFNKLDVNGNGFITANELVEVSNELGHQLNAEEANNITLTLSHDGNVPYEKFKAWWITGRGNHGSFRKVVQLSMAVNNFIRQGSQSLNEYLSKMKVESDNLSQSEKTFDGKFELKSTGDFVPGIGIDINGSTGKEAEAIIDLLPSYIKNSPINIGIEIHSSKPENSENIVKILQELQEQLAQIPIVSQFLMIGLQVNFRQTGSKIYIDLSLGGILGDQVAAQIKAVNTSQLNLSGSAFTTVRSSLKLTDLLEKTMDELIEKFFQFKISTHNEVAVFNSGVLSLVKSASGLIPAEHQNKIPLINSIFSGLSCVKSISYNSEIDGKELAELSKDVANHFLNPEGVNDPAVPTGLNLYSNNLTGMQAMAQDMIESFLPMVAMIISPYKDLVDSVNFDHLGLYLVTNPVKAYVKFDLVLAGLDDFVKKNLSE